MTQSMLRVHLAAMLTGLLVFGAITVRATQAVQTASTDNSGNAINTYAVALDDSDAETALFTVDGMIVGETEQRCLQVTYTSGASTPNSAGDPVRVHVPAYTDGGTVDDNLLVTLSEGSGLTGPAADGNCAGFVADGGAGELLDGTSTLADVQGAHSGYASGVGTWAPSSDGETKDYRVEFTLDDDGSFEYGDSVTDLTLVWEIQQSAA